MTATMVDMFDTRGLSAHSPLHLLVQFHTVISSPTAGAEAEATRHRHVALTAFDRVDLVDVEEIANMSSLSRSTAALHAVVAAASTRPAAIVQAYFLLAFFGESFDKAISLFVEMVQGIMRNRNDLLFLPMPFAGIVFCALSFLRCCLQDDTVRKNDSSRATVFDSIVGLLASLEKNGAALCAAYCEIGAPLLLWFLAQTVSQRSSELTAVRAFVDWVNGTIRLRHGSDAIGHHEALCSMALSVHLLEHGAVRNANLLPEALEQAVKADIVLTGFLECARSVVAFERLRRGHESHFRWRFDDRLDSMLVVRAMHISSLKESSAEAAVSAHYDIYGHLGGSPLSGISLPLEVVLEFEFAEAYGVRFGSGDTFVERARSRAQQAVLRPLTVFAVRAHWSRHWKWALDSLVRAFVCLDVVPLCQSVHGAFKAAAAAMQES